MHDTLTPQVSRRGAFLLHSRQPCKAAAEAPLRGRADQPSPESSAAKLRRRTSVSQGGRGYSWEGVAPSATRAIASSFSLTSASMSEGDMCATS